SASTRECWGHVVADGANGRQTAGFSLSPPPLTASEPSSSVPAPFTMTLALPTKDRLMPRPRTTTLNVPPMFRKRTPLPPQIVAVSVLSFDHSSPLTIGPVPSPSIGSLIITLPLATLPMTPPPPG